jgi:hypothetical protein
VPSGGITIEYPTFEVAPVINEPCPASTPVVPCDTGKRVRLAEPSTVDPWPSSAPDVSNRR